MIEDRTRNTATGILKNSFRHWPASLALGPRPVGGDADRDYEKQLSRRWSPWSQPLCGLLPRLMTYQAENFLFELGNLFLQ